MKSLYKYDTNNDKTRATDCKFSKLSTSDKFVTKGCSKAVVSLIVTCLDMVSPFVYAVPERMDILSHMLATRPVDPLYAHPLRKHTRTRGADVRRKTRLVAEMWVKQEGKSAGKTLSDRPDKKEKK
jgi:hypothetical protein